jgi:hypothetical protein
VSILRRETRPNVPARAAEAAMQSRDRLLLGFALLFVALLFLRHPAGILDANFWAEDGWFWYPDAYTTGLRSLVLPHTGYLQSLSRLIALIVQPVPLLWAPTVFAVVALLVQALPPVFLLSRRLVASSTLLIGIAGDWRYRDMPPTGFDAMARQFEVTAAGTRMVFPLHPIGVAPIVLTKQ